DHDHAGLEQAVAFDQLLELVGRARAQPFGLGLLHEGVGKVLLEPALAGFAAGRHGRGRPFRVGVGDAMIP
ncbi:hypothetical protein CATMIT_01717, partial [Catenibacterium mitsuokai DSM 15897]